MTHQLDFLEATARLYSHEPTGCVERDVVLAQLEKRAGEMFAEKAGDFVLSYLTQCGVSSAEDITDSAKAAGISPVIGDDRAFGAIYHSLARRGLIVKSGYCQRRKGHGTSGGNLWRLGNGQN